MMGNTSSQPELEEGEERSRSASPLPRYDHPSNSAPHANGGDGDAADGLPRFPSTMPDMRKSRGVSPEEFARPATQPEVASAQSPSSRKKKKKKSKKRQRDTEEDNDEELLPRRSESPTTFSPSQQLPDLSAVAGRPYSPPAGIRKKKSSKKGKKASKKNADPPTDLADDPISDVDETVEVPSSVKAARLDERGGHSSSAARSHKKRRSDLPLEPLEEAVVSDGEEEAKPEPSGERAGSPQEVGLPSNGIATEGQEDAGSDHDEAELISNNIKAKREEEADQESQSLIVARQQRRARTASQNPAEAVSAPLRAALQAFRSMELDTTSVKDGNGEMKPEGLPESDHGMEVDSIAGSPSLGHGLSTAKSSEEAESDDGEVQESDHEMEVNGNAGSQVLGHGLPAVKSSEEADSDDDNAPARPESDAASVVSDVLSVQRPDDVEDKEMADPEASNVEASLPSLGGADHVSDGSGVTDSEEPHDREDGDDLEASGRETNSGPKSVVSNTNIDQQQPDAPDRESRASSPTSQRSVAEASAGLTQKKKTSSPAKKTPHASRRAKRAQDVYNPESAELDQSNKNQDPPADAEPAEADEVDVAPTPPAPSAKTPKSSRSVKRKPKTPYFSRENEEIADAFAELPPDDVVVPTKTPRAKRARTRVSSEAGPSTAAAATKRAKKKQSKKEAAIDDDAAQHSDEDAEQRSKQGKNYRTGKLTAAEQAQVDSAVEMVRQNEDLTHEEIARVIQSNPRMDGSAVHQQLWSSVVEACPSRPRQKLINWCRQRYHTFVARGTWTPEQDEELMQMIKVHGTKWSEIGGLINRHQKDVRDRYRNYLICGNKANKDYWTVEEEDQFYAAIERATEGIREHLAQEGDADQSVENLINWQQISVAMNYTRSRLQCLEKWRRLQAADAIPDRITTKLPSGPSWRLDKARKELRKMPPTDKYLLTCAIRDSGVGKESRIRWKDIIGPVFNRKYERQALLVTWGRLRETVPDWESKRTDDCAKYICDMYEADGAINDLAEEATPSPSKAATPAKRQAKRGARQSSVASSSAPKRVYRQPRAELWKPSTQENMRSNSHVDPSDDEDVEEPVVQTAALSTSRRAKRQSVRKERVSLPSPDEEVDESVLGDPDTKMDDAPVAASAQNDDEPAVVRAESVELGNNEDEAANSGAGQADAEPEAAATASLRKQQRKALPSSPKKKRKLGQEKETVLLPPPTSTETPVAGPKGARRLSLSSQAVSGGIESSLSKRRKTLRSPNGGAATIAKLATKASGSKSSKKTAKTKEAATPTPKSAAHAYSDISSDMDDMDDIPAKVESGSQRQAGSQRRRV
ncbi:hypothetical protein B0T17DRAFT_532212 [Bombardia bombarda]|uniref:Uncharacterized protein n=1 Tax=Bombardia bombarda TaxID=252184 RepID=A0AA39X0V7_9PEZI|nr:hypothetical protein B0T17DRAFT_532212 [Bombardia bombarda]